MTGDPVQRGVGDEYVDWLLGAPGSDVAFDECDSVGDRVLLSVGDHLRRAVDAEDLRSCPSVGEQPRQRAGTATEIDDVRRISGPCTRRLDASKKLDERPAAFVAVPDILLRVPGDAHSR
jgi:hypothetical protein